MRSRWFDYTKPYRITSSQGDQGVYGTYTLVLGGSSAANFLEPLQCRENMCVQVYHISSGWFDYTEPFRTTSSQGDQSVYNTYTLVPGGSTTANYLLETLKCRISKVRRGISHVYTCSRWFNHSEPPRTFSNHFSAEKARCALVYHMSLGWFDYTEPFQTTFSQGDQGV